MYALTKQIGKSFEVLAVSENKTTLSQVMKAEVLTFIEETYSNDPEALEWLMPISDEMTYWSDEDELVPVIYRIKEVTVL